VGAGQPPGRLDPQLGSLDALATAGERVAAGPGRVLAELQDAEGELAQAVGLVQLSARDILVGVGRERSEALENGLAERVMCRPQSLGVRTGGGEGAAVSISVRSEKSQPPSAVAGRTANLRSQPMWSIARARAAARPPLPLGRWGIEMKRRRASSTASRVLASAALTALGSAPAPARTSSANDAAAAPALARRAFCARRGQSSSTAAVERAAARPQPARRGGISATSAGTITASTKVRIAADWAAAM
jgi:hypothetical protein